MPEQKISDRPSPFFISKTQPDWSINPPTSRHLRNQYKYIHTYKRQLTLSTPYINQTHHHDLQRKSVVYVSVMDWTGSSRFPRHFVQWGIIISRYCQSAKQRGLKDTCLWEYAQMIRNARMINSPPAMVFLQRQHKLQFHLHLAAISIYTPNST